MHPLDKPYDPAALEFIRAHLHKKVRKLSPLTREEYIILFDESDENLIAGDTIKFAAGRPISVCLCVSPLDGVKVESLVTRAFSMPTSYLYKFLRFYSIVKHSDAVALYGLEVSGKPTPFDTIREELKNYEKKVKQEVFVTVSVKDVTTGRKLSITERNGNAFDIERKCIKLLRGGA